MTNKENIVLKMLKSPWAWVLY